MRPTSGRIAAIATLAAALGVALAPLLATSNHLDLRGLWIVLTLVVSWGFVGTGLLAWQRRPCNRTGLLMVAVGLLLPLSALQGSDLPGVFAIGAVTGAVFAAAAIHLLLAFPTGDLRDRWDRLTVWTAYGVTTVGLLPFNLFIVHGRRRLSRVPRERLLIAEVDWVMTASIVVIGLLTLLDAARHHLRAHAPLAGGVRARGSGREAGAGRRSGAHVDARPVPCRGHSGAPDAVPRPS